MTKLNKRHAQGRAEHGDMYDNSTLEAMHQSIKDAYNSGARVEVTWHQGQERYVRRGRVSTTTTAQAMSLEDGTLSREL